MLTSITLKDYTTFIDETIFDFNATNYKILEDTNVGSNRVLKGALFVGENASGKTQLLSAIKLLLDLLMENSELNFERKKSLYTKGNKFSLSYQFNVDNNIIQYDIEFMKNAINMEKLYVNGELKIERLNSNGRTYFEEIKDIQNINSSLSLLKLEYYNTRFSNDNILNKWFDFLKNSIYINCLRSIIKIYNPLKENDLGIYKYADNNTTIELNTLINNLGYNSELVFNKTKEDKEKICLKKKGTNVSIPLPIESAGNKAFVNIILPIKFATFNNCMLIVDEFSSGLHNELEEALIKYFFNNSSNSQIFFTSHSTNLLDSYLLRPDQIYTFKFDAKKGTIIKRCSDENPRESQNLEKMYLNGVFDGMPKYNKEFKNK